MCHSTSIKEEGNSPDVNLIKGNCSLTYIRKYGSHKSHSTLLQKSVRHLRRYSMCHSTCVKEEGNSFDVKLTVP